MTEGLKLRNNLKKWNEKEKGGQERGSRSADQTRSSETEETQGLTVEDLLEQTSTHLRNSNVAPLSKQFGCNERCYALPVPKRQEQQWN